VRLANETVEEGDETVSDEMEIESDISELEFDALHAERRPGTPSRFTCPECNGVLWEIDDENLLRFRCRVGHAYSSDTLLAEQSDTVEAALWAALRVLEENVSLMRRLSRRMRERGNDASAARFEQQARDADSRAELLRQTLITRPPIDPVEPDPQRRALHGSSSHGSTLPGSTLHGSTLHDSETGDKSLPLQSGGQGADD